MHERTQLNQALPVLPPARKIKLVVFDFDGVFTDNKVEVHQDGSESVTCCRADGIGLKMLKDAGIESCIISSEKNEIVMKRAEKLGIPCIQGEEVKLPALVKLMASRNIFRHMTAYVGNDINDIDCMKHVMLPIAVNDADYRIRNIAKYITEARGGEGAVREVCEMIVEGAFDEAIP